MSRPGRCRAGGNPRAVLRLDRLRRQSSQLRRSVAGPDIAARIARDYGVRCVFVTANPAQIGPGEGALGYIRKPFSERAILAAAALAGEGVPPANDDVVVLPA